MKSKTNKKKIKDMSLILGATNMKQKVIVTTK